MRQSEYIPQRNAEMPQVLTPAREQQLRALAARHGTPLWVYDDWLISLTTPFIVTSGSASAVNVTFCT